MSRPTVMCDIDNTLNFAYCAYASAVNSRFNENFTAAKQQMYDFSSSLPSDQGIWLKSMHKNALMYANMAPDFRGIDALTALKSNGFRVIIATNRDPAMKGVTVQWLDQWNIPRDDLLVGPDVKVDYVTANPNTVAIDDDPAKAVLLPPHGATLWMPQRPWTPAWCSNVIGVHVFTQWSQVLENLGVTL